MCIVLDVVGLEVVALTASAYLAALVALDEKAPGRFRRMSPTAPVPDPGLLTAR